MASELLESAGATVTLANHGGEAVGILTGGEQAPPFDIVFMDLQMPEMDGFTATRLLRAEPKLQALPIIAMTAHALVEERQRCLEAGMNDHVSKPIDPDALFAALMRWTKPRQVTTEGAGARPAKPSADTNFPAVDGVDVSSGLRRVAGNTRLYRDLLVQFAAKQSNGDSEIFAALQSGDLHLAERFAHTVKGVAGNLGLGAVFGAAEKLERALGNPDRDVPALAEEFAKVLRRQVEAIQRARLEVRPRQLDVQNNGTVLDVRTTATAIAHVRALLESNDCEAAEAFLALRAALEGTFDQPRLDSLGAAITEFDFDGALLRLDEIAKEYIGIGSAK